MDYRLTLDDKQVNTVLQALFQLPYGSVADLINSIGRQLNEQTPGTPKQDAKS